jgi:hypothetical protein
VRVAETTKTKFGPKSAGKKSARLFCSGGGSPIASPLREMPFKNCIKMLPAGGIFGRTV